MSAETNRSRAMRILGGLIALVVLAGAAGAAWWYLVGQERARERAAAETVESVAAAWARADWAALAARVEPPAEPAVAGHRALVEDLEPEDLEVEPVALQIEEGTAAAELAVSADVPGLEPWSWTSRLDLAWDGETWHVRWTPEAVHPDFVAGGRFRRSRTLEPRGAILDRTGAPLAGAEEVVAVGIEPRRVEDEDELVETLVRHAGASEAEVEALLDRDDLVDDWFYPVVELARPDFEEADPDLRPVPGIVFRAEEGRAGPLGGLALHVVGRAEELSAEDAETLDRDLEPGDLAGTFGLEQALDEQLGGRPATTVDVVDAEGQPVATVHEDPGVPPADVTVTLDREVQQAAEAALDGLDEPAALVAVDPASMEVLASVSRPLAGYNRAFEGRYPPGSAFKVVTTAALLGADTDPDATFDCPARRNVGGREFRNAGDRALGSISFETAFAESCNTAYVGTMPGAEDALTGAAEAFGFDDTAHDVALDAFGGAFPEPADLVEWAAAAIGQGRVEASPLHLATVAAAAATGVWRPATLFPDGDEAEGRTVPGDPDVLRGFMLETVASGTGTAARVEGRSVGGKTGSAEFGAADPPETHAWFIGFGDDLAYAVLVEGGGAGGEIAAPVAARFLGNLP